MPSILKRLFSSRKNENYNSGITLFNEKRFEDAIACFKLALTEISKSSATYRLSSFYIAESHANIGRTLLQSSRYDEAAEHIKQALTENQNFPDLHYDYGVAIFMLGKLEEAIQHFKRALEINQDYVEARCFLAVAMHAQGDETDARDNLRLVTEAPAEVPIQASKYLIVNLKERETVLPEIGPVLELLESSGEFREIYSEGISNYNLGRHDLAVDLLKRAHTLKPHYADLQCQLGLAQFKVNRTDEAIDSFRGALSVNPRFLEAAYYLGVTLIRERRFMEAEEALGFAHEIRNDSCDIHFYLAQCKFHLGKYEEADTFLREVLERKPDFPQALYLRGLVCYSLGKFDEGIDMLRGALSDNPHLNAAERDLALMYLNQGQWDAAGDIFSQLSENDNSDVSLFCFRGQCFLERGLLDEALGDYSKALELDPENLYALKGRLRCELKLGRNNKAQTLIAPFLRKYPEYPDLRKLQGDIRFRIGNYSGAEEEYRKALELAPRYLEPKLGLILALRNQGSTEEAARILKELAAENPGNVELRHLLGSSFIDPDDLL
ncbi:MAG: tetratricopeptide repeat protein [bacterium]|nr:tetratricopeptide repeat protein [bacterium]